MELFRNSAENLTKLTQKLRGEIRLVKLIIELPTKPTLSLTEKETKFTNKVNDINCGVHVRVWGNIYKLPRSEELVIQVAANGKMAFEIIDDSLVLWSHSYPR